MSSEDKNEWELEEPETEVEEPVSQEPETPPPPPPQSNPAIAAVLNDPDIRKILEARAQGKKVMVNTESEVKPQVEQAPDLDKLLNDMSPDDPARKVIERAVEVAEKRLLGNVGRLSERLSNLEGLANEVQKRDIASQISSARAKYKDFDDYREGMLELSRSVGGLNVEELYILAKQRAGKLDMRTPSPVSEKPSNQPARGPRKPPEGPPARGRTGFARLLDSALKDLDLGKM